MGKQLSQNVAPNQEVRPPVGAVFGVPQHGPVDYRRAALHHRERLPRPVQALRVLTAPPDGYYFVPFLKQASYAGPERRRLFADELAKVQVRVIVVRLRFGNRVQPVAVQFQPVDQRVLQHPVARAGRAHPLPPVRFRGGNRCRRAVVPVCQRLYSHLFIPPVSADHSAIVLLGKQSPGQATPRRQATPGLTAPLRCGIVGPQPNKILAGAWFCQAERVAEKPPTVAPDPGNAGVGIGICH